MLFSLCKELIQLPVYRSVRVLIKEIIHDTISEKSEIEKAEERVLRPVRSVTGERNRLIHRRINWYLYVRHWI